MKYVYNVLIGGFSIGLTFNRTEALSWMQQSMYQGRKEVLTIPYKEQP